MLVSFSRSHVPHTSSSLFPTHYQSHFALKITLQSKSFSSSCPFYYLFGGLCAWSNPYFVNIIILLPHCSLTFSSFIFDPCLTTQTHTVLPASQLPFSCFFCYLHFQILVSSWSEQTSFACIWVTHSNIFIDLFDSNAHFMSTNCMKTYTLTQSGLPVHIYIYCNLYMYFVSLYKARSIY